MSTVRNAPEMSSLVIHGAYLRTIPPGDSEYLIRDLFAEIWRKEKLWLTAPDGNRPMDDFITHGELLMLVTAGYTDVANLDRYQSDPPEVLRVADGIWVVSEGVDYYDCVRVE